jgi:hypothetical protein
MEGFNTPQVSTPEEELAYLRAEIEKKEKELAEIRQESPREQVAEERILHHRNNAPEDILTPEYQLQNSEIETLVLNLDPESDDSTMQELKRIMEEKGIKNAFSVLEKMNSPHLEDDFHRFLTQYLVAGMPIKGFSEGQPVWKALHMTLYEISLPEPEGDKGKGAQRAYFCNGTILFRNALC